MRSLILLCCSFITTFTQLTAGSNDNKLTSYKDRLEMEQAIEFRLEKLLLTRLEKKYFDVSAEIKISNDPYSANYNLVNSSTLADNKIVITMGLSDKVTPLYQEELKKWLSEWSKNQYGSQAETQIVKRSSPLVKVIPKQPSQISNLGQTILKLQNLIGLLLIAGVLFTITRKTKKEQKKPSSYRTIKDESSEDFEGLYSNHTSSGIKITPTLNFQNNLLAYDQIKSLKKKIYWISSSNARNTESIIDDWRLSTEPTLKFAAFCESLAEFSQDAFEIKKLVNIWIPNNTQETLSAQISELQKLDPEDQLLIYQEVYADLFSNNRYSIAPGTSYDELIDQLADHELLNQFEKLSEPSQFLLISKLHTENKKRFNRLVDPQKMTQLLNLGFNPLDLHHSKFNSELESWKDLIRSKSENHLTLEEQIISAKEMATLLNPVDQVHWIYQSIQKYPQFKHLLAPDYKNIALLNEWHPDHLKKLCSSTATKELAAVIANFPYFSECILNSCGDQTRQDINIHLIALNESKKLEYFIKFQSHFEKFTIDQIKHPTSSILLKAVS